MAIRATRPHQRHAHRLRAAAPSLRSLSCRHWRGRVSPTPSSPSPAAAASTRYENPAPSLTGAKNRIKGARIDIFIKSINESLINNLGVQNVTEYILG